MVATGALRNAALRACGDVSRSSQVDRGAFITLSNRPCVSDSTSEHEQYDVLEPAMTKQKQVMEKQVEKKEKKVKPGAQPRQSKEEIAKKLAEKPKLSKEERREAEKLQDAYLLNRRRVVQNYIAGEWETMEEYMVRIEMEEAEKKQQWEKKHEEHAVEVQRKQKHERQRPKERTDKEFNYLVRSVGWNPTPDKLDAVLNQMTLEELGKLWIDTPLWHRARERGMIRDASFTAEFLARHKLSGRLETAIDNGAKDTEKAFMKSVNGGGRK